MAIESTVWVAILNNVTSLFSNAWSFIKTRNEQKNTAEMQTNAQAQDITTVAEQSDQTVNTAVNGNDEDAGKALDEIRKNARS